MKACCAFTLGFGLWLHAPCIRAESYAPPLLSDFTKDCRVDLDDLAILAQRWLESDDTANLSGTEQSDLADLKAAGALLRLFCRIDSSDRVLVRCRSEFLN